MTGNMIEHAENSNEFTKKIITSRINEFSKVVRSMPMHINIKIIFISLNNKKARKTVKFTKASAKI
jgi:hypothetical protein